MVSVTIVLQFKQNFKNDLEIVQHLFVYNSKLYFNNNKKSENLILNVLSDFWSPLYCYI